MAGNDDTDIYWIERDSREWVMFTHQPDQLTARMTCTYLETGGVEARVGSLGGRYCVEVPAAQLELAFTVYQPVDSAIMPPMAESSRKTGIHTGQRLRDEMRKRNPSGRKLHLSLGMKWVLRLAAIAGLALLLLLFFQG
ncbi:MAG: hypothetical protein KDB32_05435 [Planctomycetes bacterium]|nr:hypothetical protein [Planctomycetota bacterium]